MREWLGTETIELRGSTPGNDGLHSFDGGGDGNGSITEVQDAGNGAGGTGREGDDAVGQKTWFDAVDKSMECKDGVCPVPWLKKPANTDYVNHPPHYTEGGLECIEAIEAQLTPEEYRGYLKGNIAKYVWREKHKGGTESLRKASWYLERLIGFDKD